MSLKREASSVEEVHPGGKIELKKKILKRFRSLLRRSVPCGKQFQVIVTYFKDIEKHF